MNQKITLKSLLLLGAVSLSLAATARADNGAMNMSTPAVPAPSATSLGLLGQTYAGLSYSYVNLDSAPVNADSYGFEYNQPLNPGFDTVFNYDFTQAGLFAGDRAREESLTAALRAFCTTQTWGKPYVEAGIGYDWMKFASAKDHSFVWTAGVGVEFQATRQLTVTPYVRYMLANGYADQDAVNYGVKANYWVTRQWAVTAGLDRTDDKDMSYKIGANFRF